MKILADASLPYLNELLLAPFKITYYHNQYTLEAALTSHDILLCRSTLKVTQALLKNTSIRCVATASSGIDHIDTDYLNQQKINLFDAKGCNANAVADYVLSSLAYLQQKHLLPGRHVGIIGAGEVGSRVMQRLLALNFEVIAYDPLKPQFKSCTLDELKTCDILCIHANLHHTEPYPSQNCLNADFLNALKPNTVIINAARGGILNEEALLALKHPIIYCTDVYQNEPTVNSEIIQYATLCTPHIAGHSIEAKYHAVEFLSQKLYRHFDFKQPKTKHAIAPHQHITKQPWHTFALNQYDPSQETKRLKQALNISKTFLTLRQAHQHRHDFYWHNLTVLQHFYIVREAIDNQKKAAIGSIHDTKKSTTCC